MWEILSIAGILAPTVGAGAGLEMGRRERQRLRALKERLAAEALERARRAPLPKGFLELDHDGIQREDLSRILAGKILLLLAGTFAASLGIRILKLLYICGLADAPGGIFLLEPDKGQRAKFLNELPSVYLDRLVVVECASLTGGGANRDREWLNAQRPHWVKEVRTKAAAICDLLRARGLQLYKRSDDAAEVVTIISQGTTGWMGLEALPVILNQFTGAQCIGMTAHPIDDLLRSRTPQLLKEWLKAGCHGIYVEDNAPDEECPERDLLANDLGLVTLTVAPISAAANTKDAASESNNLHTLVFGPRQDAKKSGENSAQGHPDSLRLASFRIFATGIPAGAFQPHSALIPRPYVVADSMTSATINALEEVRKAQYRAVSAGFGKAGTSRFDIIMTSLEPDSLRSLEDSVITAEKTATTPPPQRNRHLLFAAMKTSPDPLKPACPIVAVSVESLSDSEGHLVKVASPIPQLGPAEKVEDAFENRVNTTEQEESRHAT